MKFIDPYVRYKNLYAYAETFRGIAMEIHEAPEKIRHYFHLPAIEFLLSDRNSTALERTVYLEALSYGDPGVLLACPGPSLSGVTLRELGTPEQIDFFYDYILKNKSRTCFALTEPNKGSDASRIQSKIIKKNDQYYLNGEKCFFGNGAVAEMGVVFAKLADNPIGLRAVLLTKDLLDSEYIQRESLPQFCLRGAQIAVMNLNDVLIPKENILGVNRSACEVGSYAIVKIFNQFRTGVGALALGQAQAVFDLCYQNHGCFFTASELDEMNEMLASTRFLLHHAAASIDRDPGNGVLVSAAKLQATQSAEKIIRRCVEKMPFDVFISHPWLVKASQDVCAWEFMEGTSQIQLMNISRKLDGIFMN
jgi:acyl-CoA dehydrogenase